MIISINFDYVYNYIIRYEKVHGCACADSFMLGTRRSSRIDRLKFQRASPLLAQILACHVLSIMGND